MRVKDELLREELRRQAESVPTPDHLWEQISLELDRNPSQPSETEAAALRRQRGPIRRLIAVGAAAGIFWVMVSPTSVELGRSGRTEQGARAAVHSQKEANRWEFANAAAEKPTLVRSKGKAASDARWPSQEITLLR